MPQNDYDQPVWNPGLWLEAGVHAGWAALLFEPMLVLAVGRRVLTNSRQVLAE